MTGYIPPTGTGKGRTDPPFLLPTLMKRDYGRTSLPLLDYCLPFEDDLPVTTPRDQRSKLAVSSLPYFLESSGVFGTPYNHSLHPIWPVVTAVASSSVGAATAAPPVQTGELNRYA